MRLLLDTHALIWWLDDDKRLSKPARDAIAKAETPLVGTGTVIELAIKASLGKLDLPDDWDARVEAQGFRVLGVTYAHARKLQALPFVTVRGSKHRDPFDRLLVAQALVESVPVVTRDEAVTVHGIAAIW